MNNNNNNNGDSKNDQDNSTTNNSFTTVTTTSEGDSTTSVHFGVNQATSLQQAGTLQFMGAVMDLGAGNVNGAAVGFAGAVNQYKTGAKLGTASPAGATAPATPPPLDTSFLHIGQGDAVGSQFEQRTGMSRDNVPPYVQGISSGGIGFHDFVKNVPNDEFRANMAAASAALPAEVKQVLAVGSEPMPEAEGYVVNLQGPPPAAPADAVAGAAPGIPSFPTTQGQPPPGVIPIFPTSQGQPPPSAAAPMPSQPVPSRPAPSPTLASLLPEGFHGTVTPVAPVRAPASRPVAAGKDKDHLDPLLDAFAAGQETEPTIFQRVTQKYSEFRHRLLRQRR